MSSIDFSGIGFDRAVKAAKRIAVGRVMDAGSFRFPGSQDVLPQEEGESLAFLRVQIRRVAKGDDRIAGKTVHLFSAAQWFEHVHAMPIRDGVMSYTDPRYQGGLPSEMIVEGCEALFFLNDEPAPQGFPPESVFLAFKGAYDRPERADEVAELLAPGEPDFDRPFVLKGRARLPDGLELAYLGHGHKRPTVGGPSREWVTVEVKSGNSSESFRLYHGDGPGGREEWGSHAWGPYRFELQAIDTDRSATILVRRT